MTIYGLDVHSFTCLESVCCSCPLTGCFLDSADIFKRWCQVSGIPICCQSMTSISCPLAITCLLCRFMLRFKAVIVVTSRKKASAGMDLHLLSLSAHEQCRNLKQAIVSQGMKIIKTKLEIEGRCISGSLFFFFVDNR